MAHTLEERKAYLVGFGCALRHSVPLINENAISLLVTLVEKWGIDLNAVARSFDQDLIDAGLTLKEAANLKPEDLQ